MRKPLIAGNWKMNKTCAQAVGLIQELKKGRWGDGVEVAVCPPFTALRDVSQELGSCAIRLGAQNVYCEDSGAFTGEVSVPMLKELGVELVIIGHSERRNVFGETDGLVNKKVTKVLKSGMVPILCVGETLEEREQAKTEDVVKQQIIRDLSGLTNEEIGEIIVAYEPIWAIGTGRSATAAEADRVIGYIREILGDLTNRNLAETIRILYGGSVKPENAGALFEMPNIDGALVGGASLNVSEFLGIIEKAAGREMD